MGRGNDSRFLHIQSCSKMTLCFVMCVVAWMRKVHLKNVEICKRSISKENFRMCESAETCKKTLREKSSCKAKGTPSRVG